MSWLGRKHAQSPPEPWWGIEQGMIDQKEQGQGDRGSKAAGFLGLDHSITA